MRKTKYSISTVRQNLTSAIFKTGFFAALDNRWLAVKRGKFKHGYLCVRDRPSFFGVPLYAHPSAKKLRKLTHIHLPDESSTQKSSWSWLVCHFSFPWWVGKGAPRNERNTKSYILFFWRKMHPWPAIAINQQDMFVFSVMEGSSWGKLQFSDI